MYFTNWLELEEFQKLIEKPISDLGIDLAVRSEESDGSYIFAIEPNAVSSKALPLVKIIITSELDVDYECVDSPPVTWLHEHIVHSLSKNEYCKSPEHEYPGSFDEYVKRNNIKLTTANGRVSPIYGYSIPGVSDIMKVCLTN